VGLTIILVALFALMWLLLIRPQRRRTSAQLEMQNSLRVGDEIITAGGIHGRITAIEGEIVFVEIAPGTTVRLDRRAIAAVERADEPEELEPIDETDQEAQPVSSGES
jgi:preprotein translocase subunit YajC